MNDPVERTLQRIRNETIEECLLVIENRWDASAVRDLKEKK